MKKENVTSNYQTRLAKRYTEDFKTILIYCRGLANRFNLHVRSGDDIVADFFLKKVATKDWKFLENYEQLGLSFLRKCLRNFIIDDYRKQSTRQRIEQENPYYDQMVHTDIYEEDTTIDNRFWSRVNSLLPKNDFDLAVLFYQESLKYKEIAELMDIPQGTVGTKVYHIKKKLKAQKNLFEEFRNV